VFLSELRSNLVVCQSDNPFGLRTTGKSDLFSSSHRLSLGFIGQARLADVRHYALRLSVRSFVCSSVRPFVHNQSWTLGILKTNEPTLMLISAFGIMLNYCYSLLLVTVTSDTIK